MSKNTSSRSEKQRTSKASRPNKHNNRWTTDSSLSLVKTEPPPADDSEQQSSEADFNATVDDTSPEEIIEERSPSEIIQENSEDDTQMTNSNKRVKFKNFKVVGARIEELNAVVDDTNDYGDGLARFQDPRNENASDGQGVNFDLGLYNSFLFHDDPNHRAQVNNVLSVTYSQKDWVSLFFTETVYEMVECKGIWETYGGSPVNAKIYLALLIQMGVTKMPELSSYWQPDRIFYAPLWTKHMKMDQFKEMILCDGDEYWKTFAEAINGSLEEFCHSKMQYHGRSWRGKVGVRRYYDSLRTKVEGSLYVLAESDGMILKILIKNEAETQSNVDVILELLKMGSGFGKLLNHGDVYVSADLIIHSKDLSMNRATKTARVSSNWIFYEVDIKLVDIADHVGCKEIMLVNFLKNRDRIEELDFDNVFGVTVDFGPRCPTWNMLSWSSRVLVDVINLTVNTAYSLNRRYNRERSCESGESLLEFRHDFVKLLLEETNDPGFNTPNNQLSIVSMDSNRLAIKVRREMTVTTCDVNSVNIKSSLHQLIPIISNKPRPRRRCKRCYKNGVRKETGYMCSACPGQYSLCKDCLPHHIAELSAIQLINY